MTSFRTSMQVMKNSLRGVMLGVFATALATSCSVNPYAETNKVYKKQAKAYARSLWEEPKNDGTSAYPAGDYWVASTNFNMRKPNFVIIHHTAQNSTEQTLKTFTTPRTQVSSHYVIGRDGKVYQMLNDYLRAWHGGAARWGNNTDINSSSIGIELDNNGYESFSDAQISSLMGVLAMLKKTHSIPAANFIGHSDIAPSRKVDPNQNFPWQKLADNGFGLWYDKDVLDSTLVETVYAVSDTLLVPGKITDFTWQSKYPNPPATFNPIEALRIIGYDTQKPKAAVKAFKLHFVQNDIDTVLTQNDKKILYNLYKKYL